MQMLWVEDNPDEVVTAISEKGWTDNELGVEWLIHFDRGTCKKADGETQLLLLDGHGSHLTYTFIIYAFSHNIEILSYLLHTTHVLQGLDVVIFQPLSIAWSNILTRVFGGLQSA
jgi:hypothetical protein